MEKELLRSLQIMAWERAKGELNSILATIYPDYDKKNPSEDYELLSKLFSEFITNVEDDTILG
jgi:hypothetical protein